LALTLQLRVCSKRVYCIRFCWESILGSDELQSGMRPLDHAIRLQAVASVCRAATCQNTTPFSIKLKYKAFITSKCIDQI